MTPADRGRVARASSLLVVAALLFPATVHAQSPEAEVLFRDGRALIKRGQLAAGCDKLAASERLETSVGTLLNLGDCREKQGKLATAWAVFRKAEAAARRAGADDKRQAEAGKRAAALEPRLVQLVIEVPHKIAGLVVKRDGELVDAAMWSTPLPVDPGTYTIAAEAPGRVAWQQAVTIGATPRRQVISVPALEPAAAVTPDAVWPPPASAVTRQAAPPARGTWTKLRAVSAVAAIAGAGAIGTGVYFGLHANDLKARADRLCPTAQCADAEGLRLNDEAQTSASRANILYIAGGATVAAAVVLWFVGAPGETVIAPMAGDRQLGVSMAGRF